MKNINNNMIIAALGIIFTGALLAFGCAEDGDSGTEGVDCGEHGSEHDGHCHCEPGYLFDGDACVAPEEITEVCEEHEEEEAEGDEHAHHACVCPDEGECHCEGEIVTYSDQDYCEPELHD